MQGPNLLARHNGPHEPEETISDVALHAVNHRGQMPMPGPNPGMPHLQRRVRRQKKDLLHAVNAQA